MTDPAREQLCRRVMVELVFLLADQRRARAAEGRDWSLLRALIREAVATGLAPEKFQEGPWVVGQRALKKPGPGGLRFMPVVERGRTEIIMPTPQEAEELAAVLNWCGVPEFEQR